jgi:phenylacetic acid degradation operon negative regulatory protein
MLTEARTSEFVYSSMSFYATRRGGELRGPWLVAALGALGRSASSVRQTLWRMEQGGEVVARREGRVKLYRLTPLARAEVEIGTDKIFHPPEAGWDGKWTLVVTAFDGNERPERERLRAVLDAEGFATLAPGVSIHPRDRGERIRAAAEEQGIGARVHVFRADRLAGKSPRRFVEGLWDLPEVARRYRAFLRQFAPLAHRVETMKPQEAFAARFAVVLRYLRAAWPDPELPRPLLPDDWPGREARALAAGLYRRLLPGALRFGDSLLERR